MHRAHTHAAVIAGAGAAAVAALALMAGCTSTSAPHPSSVPAALHASGSLLPPASTPSAAIPPPASTPPPAPDGLLTGADVRPDFTGVDVPFGQPYTPNPLVGCGPDGLPGPGPVRALGESFLPADRSGTGPMGGETVLAYPSGGASSVITALSRAVHGACHGHLRIVSAGPGSLLLGSTDPAIAAAQQAHGQILYYGLESRGDHLAWITLIEATPTRSAPGTVSRLLRLAVQRMCTASAC